MTELFAILTGVFAVVGAAIILHKPQYAIVLILIMFPLEQLLMTYFPIFATNNTLVNIGIGMLVIFAVVSAMSKGQPIFNAFLNPAFFAAFGVFAIDVLGLLWTPVPEIAIGRMQGGMPYYVLMLGISPLLLKDLEDFRRLLLPLLAASSILSILLVFNPASMVKGSGRLMMEVGDYTQRTGPLALGTLGGMATIVAVAYVPPVRSIATTLLRAGSLLLGFGLALASGSRGQVMAAVLLSVIAYPVARKVKDPKQFFLTMLGLGIVMLGLYASFSIFISADNEARWSAEGMESAVDGRLSRVLALVEAFLSNPQSWLFGLGPMAFVHYWGADEGYVHNQVVEIFCESGLIAFTLYAGALVFVFRRWRAMWQLYREDPCYRSAATCFGALLVNEWVLSMKQGTHVGVPLVFMWMVLLAKVAITELQNAPVLADEPSDWEDEPDGEFAPSLAGGPQAAV